MKINQLKAGSLLSYLQMGLRIIIGLVYTPVMLKLLGQSEFGLYNTVSSTISMMSILSLGFNSSYIRFYSQYKKKEDNSAIDRLNGLFISIFLLIGAIALSCGLFLSNHLELVFDQGLTGKEYEKARVLMLLLTCNLAVSFPMSVFQSIISAHEKFIVLKILAMMKTVLGPFLTLPLLLMGYDSVGMVLVTLLIALVTDVIYLYYSKRILKVKFAFRGIDFAVFKSIFIFTSFIAINMIVDQINSNMDKFLLARYRGTTAVAVYSLGYTLYQYFVMFSTAVSGVFAPRVHRIVNEYKNNQSKQGEALTSIFTKVGRIQFLILGLLATGMVFFGKPFIQFWAGEGYEESYYVMLLLVIPAITPLIQNIGIEIQRAQNNHRFRSIAYLVMAVFNCIFTIYLCPQYGAVGAAIGTAISFVLANGITINIFYHKRCGINIISFWRSIFRMARGFVIPVAFGIILMCTLKEISFVWKIGFYIPVYCGSMWMFGMNEEEKKLIVKPIKQVFSFVKR